MVLEPQEQEILDRLKSLARTYGLPVGLGLFFSLALIGGWNIYQGYKISKQGEATDIYQNFLQLSDEYDRIHQVIEEAAAEPAEEQVADASTGIGGQAIGTGVQDQQREELNITLLEARQIFLLDNVKNLAGVLEEEHSDLAYASFAGVRVAGLDSMAGDTTAAVARLQRLLGKSSSPEVSRVVGLTLARTLFSENRLDEAISVLNSDKLTDIEVFSLSELRGDIHALKGETDLARDQYMLALKQGGDAEILNYKIASLSLSN